MGTNDLPPLKPVEPAQRSGGWGCLGCLGVLFLIVVLAVGGVAINNALNPPDACDEASDARMLAETLDNPDDRTIAAMQYAVKAAECERIGGSVD